ncbi:MAG: hypothetical protein WCE45_01625 [Sedimentisphaerales bacterium]
MLKFQVFGIYDSFAGVFGHFWDDFNEIAGSDDHLDISSFQVFLYLDKPFERKDNSVWR